MGKYFVFFALCAGWACKLSTPAAFFDPTPDNNEMLKTMNVRAGGELYSGVVAGTLPSGVTGVDIKFDDGEFKKAIIDGTRWKIFIPTGPEAAAGKQRWQVGSKHTLYTRARGVNGNASSNYGIITFTRQLNRDVNGDGYADVVVGASLNDGGTGASDKGAAYVFYGSAWGTTSHSLSASPYTCSGTGDCTIIQNPLHEANGSFGSPVSFAGDANGDGYADILVGAPKNDGGTGAADKGAAYVYYGSATGVTSHPLSASPYTCSGTSDCTAIQNPLHEAGVVSGNFGVSVRFAADVNGDGYGDIIIGAPQNDGGTGAADKGAAYVFYGSATGITSHPLSASPYTCSGSNDCTVIQNPLHEAAGQFGISISFAGDVNNDGYADVVIGAPQNDGGTGAAGKGVAYVYYGSATGVTSHPLSASPYTCSGTSDCTEMQNPLHEANGFFGTSVSFAGDVNGDGYADVAVAAINNDSGTGAAEKGAVYVYYGSATGVTSHPLSANPYTCAGPKDCTVMQNPLHEANGLFGTSVSFAGDVNSDGYADVVVGAANNDGGTGAADKGAAYVYYGSTSGVTSHPLSANPYTCANPNDCTVMQNPLHEAIGLFGTSVSFAGDVNGDGYADVMVGAANNDGGTGAAGKGVAYVYYGSGAGITAYPLSASPYTCSGSSDCTEIQNPLHEAYGSFGTVGYLWQPAERREWPELAPQQPAKPHQLDSIVGVEYALAARREEALG